MSRTLQWILVYLRINAKSLPCLQGHTYHFPPGFLYSSYTGIPEKDQGYSHFRAFAYAAPMPWFIHSIVWVPIILFEVTGTYHKQMEKESCPYSAYISNMSALITPLAQLCWPPDLKEPSLPTTPLFHIPLSSSYLITLVPFWHIMLLFHCLLPISSE